MDLITESYGTQTARWPRVGRVILAQFDDDFIVVYRAFRPAIGQVAARNDDATRRSLCRPRLHLVSWAATCAIVWARTFLMSAKRVSGSLLKSMRRCWYFLPRAWMLLRTSSRAGWR